MGRISAERMAKAPLSELQGVGQYQELIDLELLKMGAFPAADNDSSAVCLRD
jgi:hypothetical protein